MAPQTQTPDITHVHSRTISCDGGDGPAGHPRIYLRITGTQVTCPYCSKIFVLDSGAEDNGH